MPEETEPTPAVPAPDEARPPARTEDTATARAGVRVPKWLAVGVVALALAGGGFAIGRVTASDHHGGFAPIGDNRPGGAPGGGRGGDRNGPGFGADRNGPGPGGDANGPGLGGGSTGNSNGGSNGPMTPSTTPGTTGA